MLEIFSLIYNVFKMLNRQHSLYVISIIFLVFISSFAEIFAISLILPLFNFLFENEINLQFITLVNIVNYFSGYFLIDARIIFGFIVFLVLIKSFLIKLIN